MMPDDKAMHGASDRRRVAAKEPYEVAYFAKKHGISIDDAKKIINKTKGSRRIADEAARALKAAG
jgi:ribosomal protein S19E (S16A)